MTDIDNKSNTNTNIVYGKNMKICNQAYTLTHKIGSGNFGQVFLGIYSSGKPAKGDKMVAIKIQKQIAAKPVQLVNQIEILKILNSDQQVIGFPKIFEYGFQKGSHFLIMELLGPSLNDLMKMCGGRFSLSTTLILSMQMFERIQYLHSKGYVCRDIKPQNFLMGIGKKSPVLYLIDFGLSKRFRNPKINIHMPYKQQRDFSGTLRYASICSHLRIQHSRRDDLQSICYMIIYFLLGSLPWQNNQSQSINRKQRLILQKKMKINTSQLCTNIPIQFKNILQYCIQLDYYQQPDYQFIQNQLLELYEKLLAGKDFIYDWANINTQKNIYKQELTVRIKPHQAIQEIYSIYHQKKASSQSIRFEQLENKNNDDNDNQDEDEIVQDSSQQMDIVHKQ